MPSRKLLSNENTSPIVREKAHPNGKEKTMRKPSRRHLHPVRDVAPPSLQFRTIHGYRRAFRIAGSGPAAITPLAKSF